MKPNTSIPQPTDQFLFYQDVHSRIALRVRFDGDDVWLTQPQIALLFHTTHENVNQHIRNMIVAVGYRVKSSVAT